MTDTEEFNFDIRDPQVQCHNLKSLDNEQARAGLVCDIGRQTSPILKTLIHTIKRSCFEITGLHVIVVQM